jgi:hypothetical protein
VPTASRVQMPIAVIGSMWVTVLILMLSCGARAATSFSAQSAMGINLGGVSYYTSEQPFINSFVTSERWITHSDATWDTKEEKYLNLDANGWPITLNSVNEPTAKQFNSLGVVFLHFFWVCPTRQTVFIPQVSTSCSTTGRGH